MFLHNGDVKVEPFSDEHAPFAWRINQDVMPRKKSWDYHGRMPQMPVFQGASFAAVHHERDDSQYGFLFSEPARRVVGFVYASQNSRCVVIHDIAVAKRFQRQGVGSMLLKAVIDQLGERDLFTAPVPDGDGMAEALLFFRKNGLPVDKPVSKRLHPASNKIAYKGYQCKYKRTL